MTLKIFQVNLRRSRAAHDMAWATATQNQVDLVVASEPNVAIVRKAGWVVDLRNDVAIYRRNKGIVFLEIVKGEGFVILRTNTLSLVCCYCTPNCPIESYMEYLIRLMDAVKRVDGGKVIMGDFNTKAFSDRR